MQKEVYTKKLLKFCRPVFKAALGCALIMSAGQTLAQGAWNFYRGDVLPDASTPAFVTSNVSPAVTADQPAIVATEQSIINNPDDANGRVLSFRIAGSPHTSFMWRMNLPASTPAATIVVRAKGLENVDRVFEMDLDFGSFRETVYILSNGTYSTRSNSQQVSLGEGFNAFAWHTYRFSKSGSTVMMYVDEATNPVLNTQVTLAGTNNYFRFGDGTGTPSYGALLDWVIWDPTGSFSPVQHPLPTQNVLAVRTDAATPARTSIYPNPTNGSQQAKVNFTLPTASEVSIQLYDITGKKVSTKLALGNLHAATHEVSLPVNGLAKGVYFCHINTNKSTLTQKLIVN